MITINQSKHYLSPCSFSPNNLRLKENYHTKWNSWSDSSYETLNRTNEPRLWSQRNPINNVEDISVSQTMKSVIELVPQECHQCNPPWTPSASHSLFPSAPPLLPPWNRSWTSGDRNDRCSPSPIFNPEQTRKTEEKKTLTSDFEPWTKLGFGDSWNEKEKIVVEFSRESDGKWETERETPQRGEAKGWERITEYRT